MRILSAIFSLIICTCLFCCKSKDDLEIPAVVSMPYFNQVNSNFETNHIQCLLDQWYSRKYESEPIVLRVINDAKSSSDFFSCSAASSLPPIDFAKNSLIVGMKSDYGKFVASPVRISEITQHLVQTSNEAYLLRVKVTGDSSNVSLGGEWFAFTSVVPKINGTVGLDIVYQFK